MEKRLGLQLAEKTLRVHLTGPHAFASVHNEKGLTLASFLTQKGWKIVEDLDEADAICAVELPVTRLHFPKRIEHSKTKGLLILQEPSVVRPFHKHRRQLDRFAKRIEVGRWADSSFTPWPAMYLDDFEEYCMAEKLPRACMIASNKLSMVPGELYSLRRQVVDSNPNVDLYGQGWDSPKQTRLKQIVFELYVATISGALRKPLVALRFLRNVRKNFGPVNDKLSTNAKYKVTVVIENSREYMSEKLLEAISAGSIPVYVGPKVTDFGIPEGLVIEVEPDVESVNAGIAQGLRADFESWAQNCREWLSEETKKLWSLEAFWATVHEELSKLARQLP